MSPGEPDVEDVSTRAVLLNAPRADFAASPRRLGGFGLRQRTLGLDTRRPLQAMEGLGLGLQVGLGGVGGLWFWGGGEKLHQVGIRLFLTSPVPFVSKSQIWFDPTPQGGGS